jgi:hypothetical protein
MPAPHLPTPLITLASPWRQTARVLRQGTVRHGRVSHARPDGRVVARLACGRHTNGKPVATACCGTTIIFGRFDMTVD